LVVDRSTSRTDTDPAFTAATTARATRAGVVHLRWATPGLPVELRNTHPFRYGTQAFAHNGAIYPVERRDEVVSAPWQDRLQGTTDSERYFLAVLAEIPLGLGMGPTSNNRLPTSCAVPGYPPAQEVFTDRVPRTCEGAVTA